MRRSKSFSPMIARRIGPGQAEVPISTSTAARQRGWCAGSSGWQSMAVTCAEVSSFVAASWAKALSGCHRLRREAFVDGALPDVPVDSSCYPVLPLRFDWRHREAATGPNTRAPRRSWLGFNGMTSMLIDFRTLLAGKLTARPFAKTPGNQ